MKKYAFVFGNETIFIDGIFSWKTYADCIVFKSIAGVEVKVYLKLVEIQKFEKSPNEFIKILTL